MSEIEIITDGGRRRRWSAAEKLRIVEETLYDGESISAVARRNGVAPNLLYRWRKLMLEGGSIAVTGDDSVTSNKTVREMESRVSDEAAAIVRQRQLLVPRGCPFLFPGDVPGQPVKEIRRFWLHIHKEVKIPDVRIHDLRHTFASLLVSGGASLEMIGKLLGHSQMQTTQRYAHLMDLPLRAGVDAVASAFRPRPQLVHDNDETPKTG